MAEGDSHKSRRSSKKRKRDIVEATNQRGTVKRQKSGSGQHHKDGRTRDASTEAQRSPRDGPEDVQPPVVQMQDLTQGLQHPSSLNRTDITMREDGRETPKQWKMSRPIGGRMLDVDSVFSRDEEYLIIIYNTSIQIYSTADSLLVRRIPFASSYRAETLDVAAIPIRCAHLSKVASNLLWVASSDNRIWCIDWTTGAGADKPYELPIKSIRDVTVDQVPNGDDPEDVLLILEKTSHSNSQIIAYSRQDLELGQGQVLHECENVPHMLRSADRHSVVVGVTKTEILVGIAKSKITDIKTLADMKYRFFSFEINDQLTCIDLRYERNLQKQEQSLDLVVGCSRGSVLLYCNVLDKLPLGAKRAQNKEHLRPRTFHWHRRAVHSVKWSLDGNYVISGGSECVLVLWQLDSGRVSFLPRISASIENIVVSPRGSSYAVHLDDNSAMVLSTADMTPTTYISGVQSIVQSNRPSKDALVRRVWPANSNSTVCVPAVCNPLHPSHLLIATGSGQQQSKSGETHTSTPYLQVYDLESSRSVWKQAVARASTTDSIMTSSGYPVTEPAVTRIAFSPDGRWLATVDEWRPPRRDVESFADSPRHLQDVVDERTEIYLKFWAADEEATSFYLVTRINEAHRSNKPEAILGLAADPSSARFATVGGDGTARIWVPKRRRTVNVARTGAEQRESQYWVCSQSIAFHQLRPRESDPTRVPTPSIHSGAVDVSEDGSTLFVAYGDPAQAAVYIIDIESGQIRNTLFDLFSGCIMDLKVVAYCLVGLSDRLAVYNVVTDEILYGFNLSHDNRFMKNGALLATNRRSRSFALALPQTTASRTNQIISTELAVFSIDDYQVQARYQLPNHRVLSLVPDISASGYIILDSAAQIWSLGLGAEITVMAQPLTDLGLDKDMATHDQRLAVANAGEDEEVMSDTDPRDIDAEDEAGDYNIPPAAVAPQRLAEVFNDGPAFAAPRMEDLFYRVAELFRPKGYTAASA